MKVSEKLEFRDEKRDLIFFKSVVIRTEDVFDNLTVEKVVDSIRQNKDAITYCYFDRVDSIGRKVYDWAAKRK